MKMAKNMFIGSIGDSPGLGVGDLVKWDQHELASVERVDQESEDASLGSFKVVTKTGETYYLADLMIWSVLPGSVVEEQTVHPAHIHPDLNVFLEEE